MRNKKSICKRCGKSYYIPKGKKYCSNCELALIREQNDYIPTQTKIIIDIEEYNKETVEILEKISET